MSEPTLRPIEVAAPRYDIVDHAERRGMPVCEAMRHWLSGDVSVPSLSEFRSRFGWAERNWRDRRITDTHTLLERDQFIREFGFAVPTREALDRIAAFSPLIEIGAGTGSWARLLAMRGADIIATDPSIASFGHDPWERFYHPIIPLQGKTAVRRWPERNVFCCWASLSHTWLRQAARAMRPGRTLIVMREEAIADERTWDYIASTFRDAGEPVSLPNWGYFLHDYMECWIKRGRV
jgi:hypothetical protein